MFPRLSTSKIFIMKMKIRQTYFLIFFLEIYLTAVNCDVNVSCKNDTLFPIIGVVSQELPPNYKELYPAYSSFIPASYVKAVESSGARVVPVLTNRNESYYRDLLNSINGIVLPGGRSKSGPGNPYYDTVKKIYRISEEINNKNPCAPFPILGVCLGYEFLITVSNLDEFILRECNIDYENLPLHFSLDPEKTKLFSHLACNQYYPLKTANVTVNHHIWCLYEKDFQHSPLKNYWIVTSTSTSKDKKTFIATLENTNYPFFGIQFHPEKIAFEWNKNASYPHSAEALQANRYFYDFLIKLSRTNGNTFPDSNAEYDHLIYNYEPVHSRYITGYEQIYLFK